MGGVDVAILAKRTEKQFTPAPAGTHQAVAVDVVDLGLVETTWDGKTKTQHKIAIVWQIAERMANGKPFLVRERYTNSLDERAKLRAVLEAWRGRPFTDEELDGFDVETVIGANCILSIVHKQGSRGGTFANVASVAPLMRGMTKMVAEDYVRVIERTPEHPPDDVPPPHGDDEDSIPF